MKPFYFGRSDQPLFGVCHPADGAAPRRGAAILCYPFGAEYSRSHRAFRELGHQLAAVGFQAFRFDFLGTGDSAGAADQGTVEQWLEDVGSAIDEAKETAGGSRVSLVGLRFGATLAALAAAKRRDVDKAVLWDPVVAGPQYLAELVERHAALVASRPRPKGYEQPDPATEVLGFPLTLALRQGIEAVDLLALSAAPAPQVAVISSENDALTLALCARLQKNGAVVEHEHQPGPKVWLRQDTIERSYVPHATLGVIASWLCR
jgi:pimeloyl-ACP methyl ester carboxylesterase